MKLPTIKKILREDLKDAPSWVDGLIGPLNGFMETVYQALNKNITLSENIGSFLTEQTFKTVTTYPTGQGNISFQNELKTRPVGVILMQIYDRQTFTPPPGPTSIQWTLDVNQIVVYPITGLEADKTYVVRLAVF